MESTKMDSAIPENTTEISTEISHQSVNHSQELKLNHKKCDRNEGQIEEQSNKKINARKIVSNCHLENISEDYCLY